MNLKRKFSYVGGNAKRAYEKAQERIEYLEELLEGWKQDLKIIEFQHHVIYVSLTDYKIA